ncbi:MAG: BPL-N domain-containing protein, partial [Deltaproteobacteria bacterium]
MTTDRSSCNTETLPKRPCALFWDESFLWGVMAWRALREARQPFDLIRAEDIRSGALSRYRMIFVPGGWASNKLIALGEEGCKEIRLFVEAGGSYLGICGGAGMATNDGIGLMPVGRQPSRQRVPSFSGGIRISPADHIIWKGIEEPAFTVWWPSQFRIENQHDTRVLASYEEAQIDAFSSDVRVEDGLSHGWPVLEERYGILLDPARLQGEPAVLEGRYGKGKVILSMLHFDTPGDPNGAVVLRNLWGYLASSDLSVPPVSSDVQRDCARPDWSPEILASIEAMNTGVTDLITTGESNFLWYWRNSLLLLWRRGVRGLEYSALAVMTAEIGKCLDHYRCGYPNVGLELPEYMDPVRLQLDLMEIRRQITPFVAKAQRLLVRERFYLQRA